jgi:hypothetical protein
MIKSLKTGWSANGFLAAEPQNPSAFFSGKAFDYIQNRRGFNPSSAH